MRKTAKASALLVVLLGFAAIVSPAQAASLLDATTTTAITGGWTDMKDTFLALLNTSWGPFLGISVIAMSPAIIKKMLKSSAK